jgi:hypothetical protein
MKLERVEAKAWSVSPQTLPSTGIKQADVVSRLI